MKIIPFTFDLSSQWDAFVEKCKMSTFLHTRKFLSYHQDRFQDASVIICDEEEKWLGVFPAALQPGHLSTVVSHPGITYGGILHQDKLTGHFMMEAMEKLVQYYQSQRMEKIVYKAIPSFYHQVPANDDLYALFRLGAQLYRRDLSTTIDLSFPSILSNKAQSKLRNMLRKAEKNGVYVDNNQQEDSLSQYWKILTENLRLRHNSKPVHSLQEIQKLLDLFPQNIQLWTACVGEEVIAGTLLFLTDTVMHTQYLAVNEKGKEFFALDVLIQFCINKAREEKFRFFDFGISTEEQGNVLNTSLYSSKAKHGGTGTLHDFYCLKVN